MRTLSQEYAEIYKIAVGCKPRFDTNLGRTITAAYIHLLQDVPVHTIRNFWLIERRELGKAIMSKRTESVLYKDSVVVPLAWLVSKHRITIPKLWPDDLSYLEEFYLTVGYSTEGLF